MELNEMVSLHRNVFSELFMKSDYHLSNLVNQVVCFYWYDNETRLDVRFVAMKHRFDKPGSKARFITKLAVDQPCEKAEESDPSLPWLAQWCQLQNQIPSTQRDLEDVRMQPSQCQLLLDENPLLFQATTTCDQALTLDMAQLNHETFPPSLYDLVFPTSTVLPSSTISSAISSAVSIPKPSMMTARYYDRYDQFDSCGSGFDPLDLELMAVTNDLGLDDPLSSSFGYDPNFDNPLSPTLCSPNSDHFKHIMSGGKRNLDQEPTLAQLNANELDEPFLDNLDFDLPVLLPEEKSGMIPLGDYHNSKMGWDNDKTNAVQTVGVSSLTQDVLSTSFPLTTTAKDLIAASNTISTPQLQIDRKTEVEGLIDVKPKIDLLSTSSPAKKQSTLHDLLTQQRTSTKSNVLPFGAESLPSTVSPRLSSSAPTLPSVEQIWKISQVVKTESVTEEVPTSAASTSSLSTNDVCSPKDDYDSNDEGFDSDPEDSDHYDEMSSDADSTVSDDYDMKRNRSLTSPSPKTSKKERFFWQYNVQAKGPKINRLSLSPCNTDPHTLNEITDPVFSPNCYVQGIKHSGKARRGDGNDLTPNPRKLYQIGMELRKLNKVINDLTPVSELPFNARPKSRKEKNKLASRACRLKKKAQHEANKLKLYGLEHEHRKLLTILKDARQLVAQHMDLPAQRSDGDLKLTNELDKLLKNSSKTKIAGRTADFVNEVIDSINAGNKPLTVLENL